MLPFALVPLLCLAPTAKAQQFDIPASARAAIIAETNAYRASKGLPSLKMNAGASAVARAYALYLVQHDKAGHGADGKSTRQRLEDADVKFCQVWENFHMSWTRPKRASSSAAVGKAMRFWKTSPGHEKGLRSPATEIGVGVAGWKHGNRWLYAEVQMFIITSCL